MKDAKGIGTKHTMLPAIGFISHPCACSISHWLLLSVLLGAPEAHGPDNTRRHLFSFLHLAHAYGFFQAKLQMRGPQQSYRQSGLRHPTDVVAT